MERECFVLGAKESFPTAVHEKFARKEGRHHVCWVRRVHLRDLLLYKLLRLLNCRLIFVLTGGDVSEKLNCLPKLVHNAPWHGLELG